MSYVSLNMHGPMIKAVSWSSGKLCNAYNPTSMEGPPTVAGGSTRHFSKQPTTARHALQDPSMFLLHGSNRREMYVTI